MSIAVIQTVSWHCKCVRQSGAHQGSSLLEFDEDPIAILGMEEHHWLPVRSDLQKRKSERRYIHSKKEEGGRGREREQGIGEGWRERGRKGGKEGRTEEGMEVGGRWREGKGGKNHDLGLRV